MKLHIAALKANLFMLFFTSLNAFAVVETTGLQTAPNEKGKLVLDIRSRLEHVEQNNSLRNATVSTLRTRLGYRSGSFQGFAGLVEVEDIRAMGNSYNSTSNGKIRHSVIADPKSTEINRAYISYAGMFDTAFTYGRQRLILDNSRFLGNVGWRQNEQTFDAFKVENTSFTDTKITLAYVDKVHSIFGDDSERGDVDMQSPIINIHYKGSPMLNISGYGYFLSFDNDPAASRQTSGIRVKGEYPLNNVALLYAAEYARQSDYKDGIADINADYRHLVAGARFAAITTEIGYETLSGDGEYAFQTPLATGHAFNGWADQFLVTPLNGLTDVYVSANTFFAGIKWKAVYHDFSADRGGVDYGNELNLLIVKNFSKRYTVGLKYASYSADDFSTDTEKIQIYAQINI
ncbi:MAG: alginate export family protein [Pseudomonadales bacterium]